MKRKRLKLTPDQLLATILTHHGNLRQAALALGITRRTIYKHVYWNDIMPRVNEARANYKGMQS